MSTTDMPVSELVSSLTGFDELAIDKFFDLDVYEDNPARPIMLTRALIFAHLTRSNLPAPEARKQAMAMTVTEVGDYFAPEPQDLDDEPESPAGKDDSEPSAGPTASPRSVFAPESNQTSTAP